MNAIETFENVEFGRIRAVTINDEPWFVGKDVAEALGYSNPRKALIDHVDEEDKGVTECDTLGGKQNMTIINESGLYGLIFGSKLPNAKKFKRWVTSEVLPSIRKTGSYSVKENLPSYQIADPIERAKKWIEEEQARQNLLAENTEMKPKADFFDAVTDSKDAIPMGDVAKVLDMGIGRNKLFEILRKKKILMRNNRPYQKFIDDGLFRVVETKYTKPNGDICVNIKTLVYQKGVDYIRKKISR